MTTPEVGAGLIGPPARAGAAMVVATVGITAGLVGWIAVTPAKRRP